MRVLRYCIVTRQITATNADEKIKQLYETAFPEDLLSNIEQRHLNKVPLYALSNL